MQNFHKLWTVNQVLQLIYDKNFKGYDLNTTQRFILIAIGFFSKKNYDARVEIEEIAYYCSLNPRTVRNNIKKLIDLKIISQREIIPSKGKKPYNVYTIHIGRLDHQAMGEVISLVDNLVADEQNDSPLGRLKSA